MEQRKQRLCCNSYCNYCSRCCCQIFCNFCCI